MSQVFLSLSLSPHSSTREHLATIKICIEKSLEAFFFKQTFSLFRRRDSFFFLRSFLQKQNQNFHPSHISWSESSHFHCDQPEFFSLISHCSWALTIWKAFKCIWQMQTATSWIHSVSVYDSPKRETYKSVCALWEQKVSQPFQAGSFKSFLTQTTSFETVTNWSFPSYSSQPAIST